MEKGGYRHGGGGQSGVLPAKLPRAETTLTICALKTIIKADAAIDQKIICLTAIAVCSEIPFLLFTKSLAKVGKPPHCSSFLSPPAAPDCRLKDKLKTAMLPAERRGAEAVMNIKII